MNNLHEELESLQQEYEIQKYFIYQDSSLSKIQRDDKLKDLRTALNTKKQELQIKYKN